MTNSLRPKSGDCFRLYKVRCISGTLGSKTLEEYEHAGYTPDKIHVCYEVCGFEFGSMTLKNWSEMINEICLGKN
jgi:hypothetical protein